MAVSLTRVISDLTTYYKGLYPNIDDAIFAAGEKVAEYVGRLDEDRVIGSTVEGNTFSWDSYGYSSRDWFSIWTAVKKNLEECKDGQSPSRGVFKLSHRRMSH